MTDNRCVIKITNSYQLTIISLNIVDETLSFREHMRGYSTIKKETS